MNTNMTDRDRQRFADTARELALSFIELAEAVENDEVGTMAARSIVISITGPRLLHEITEVLKDSLPAELDEVLGEDEDGGR